MSYNWDGLMELFTGKYRPTWSTLCGASDVKGVMELADGKYRPKVIPSPVAFLPLSYLSNSMSFAFSFLFVTNFDLGC